MLKVRSKRPNKITFSHIYDKMILIDLHSPVILLEVFQIRSDCLSPDFKHYDTQFEKGKYPLPYGMVLVLLFKQGHNLFTTVRSFNPHKYNYYLDQRGQKFNIHLDNKK